MDYTPEQKRKLKNILREMSSPEERLAMDHTDMLRQLISRADESTDKLNKVGDDFMQKNMESMNKLESKMSEQKKTTFSFMNRVVESFDAIASSLTGKLEELKKGYQVNQWQKDFAVTLEHLVSGFGKLDKTITGGVEKNWGMKYPQYLHLMLRNTTKWEINPATEEKQNDIIAAIGGIVGSIQYANNFAIALPTGTVALGFDGTHVRAIKTAADGTLQTRALAYATDSVDVTGSSVIATVNTITNYALETGGNLASIKTNTDKIPSLGQALATGSVPVVLTAIQLSALTPPSAITNYALETGGNLATLVGAIVAGKMKVSSADGDVFVRSASASTFPVDTELPAAATIGADAVTPTVPGIAAYNFIKTSGADTWDRWYGTTAHSAMMSIVANNAGTAVDLAIYNSTQSVLAVGIGAFPTGANAMDVNPHTNTGMVDGRKVVTTSGSRVALATSTACRQVIITAETDNTGIVVVGGSTCVAALATRQGIPLYPGDSLDIDITNLANVYLDAMVNTDGVTFIYFT